MENGGGIVLLARWTSDWDCNVETQWWYCIKDTPFDISKLKSKRRYEINKGKRNFATKRIHPVDYSSELLKITELAFEGWPEKYRPKLDKQKFLRDIENWNDAIVIGVFSIDDNKMSGYAKLYDHDTYCFFTEMRTDPACEHLAINAALINGILEYFDDKLKNGYVIIDGERSIRHESAFQNYLEKYFEFRKAYCRLNIRYRIGFGMVVKVLYPFRKYLNIDTKLGNNISGIMKMEEIKRSCEGNNYE